MTPPDTHTLSKTAPKAPRRFWLYAPFAALLLAILAWILGWMWMRDDLYRRMDAGALAMESSGYRLDWTARSISGFPFRLDLDLTAPRLSEASGWGLSAPRLKAEAFVFASDHWVIVAPDGATLHRRVGGDVRIAAKALRASLSAMDSHPPSLSVEGLDLTFTAGPGGAPVAFTQAEGLHLHAKAGPRDQGAAYAEIDAARTAGPGRLDDIAAGAPVTLIADGIFSHASALRGPGLAGALRNWREAGGRLTVRRLSLETAGAAVEARGGELGADADGRLAGDTPIVLTAPTRLLSGWAARGAMDPEAVTAARTVLADHTRANRAAVTAHFQAGQFTLGPVALGPAARIY